MSLRMHYPRFRPKSLKSGRWATIFQGLFYDCDLSPWISLISTDVQVDFYSTLKKFLENKEKSDLKGPRYMPGSRWTNIAFLQPFLKDSETIRECLHLQWKSCESGCRKLLRMPSRILITSFCQMQNAILNLFRIQTIITKTKNQRTQSCACNIRPST